MFLLVLDRDFEHEHERARTSTSTSTTERDRSAHWNGWSDRWDDLFGALTNSIEVA